MIQVRYLIRHENKKLKVEEEKEENGEKPD